MCDSKKWTRDDEECHSENSSSDSSSSSPPSKIASIGSYSSVSAKLMSKMGYQSGLGLGKKSQGRVEPVQFSKQRGRRGLGLIIPGLESGSVEWNQCDEHIDIHEKVEWISSPNTISSSAHEMTKYWLSIGQRKESIDDEISFVHPSILSDILKCKSIFDALDGRELRNARTRSNPFESIKGAIFINRAAVKMANIDAVCDFMFTNPVYPNGSPFVDKNRELLYFADVCAGPGGFSEYVLWKKGWKAKGFGFTLKAGENDFKLEDFYSGSPESFETHYGVGGADGDGNVMDENNIREFSKYVLSQTNNLGVHFMMADGGFTVEGRENIQEILSKQLYLCQSLVALNIVRTQGHFLCKLFDIFTPFSVGLLYLLYLSFDSISIHKPNSSRPANSERYVLCKWKRENTTEVKDYMFSINRRLIELGLSPLGMTKSSKDINEIVPFDLIKADTQFFNYIYESNNRLGRWQIVSLSKIVAFTRDNTLHEFKQTDIRESSLALWKVPNELRKARKVELSQDKAIKLLCDDYPLLLSPHILTTPSNIESLIKSIYDWKCVFLGETLHNGSQGFYLSHGRSHLYTLSTSKIWVRGPNTIKVEFPEGTLVYGEIVREMKGELKNQKRFNTFHIIDAAFLGKEDIRYLDTKIRNERIQLFVKAMNKPCHKYLTVIRSKELFGLESLPNVIQSSLSLKALKGQRNYPMPAKMIDDDPERFYCPKGIMLLRIVPKHFMIAVSKSCHRKYWYHTETQKSAYELPKEALCDFKTSFTHRLIWNWENCPQILNEQPSSVSNKELDTKQWNEFILSKL